MRDYLQPDADPLYQAALQLESDEQLASEMAEWDIAAEDGLTPSRQLRGPSWYSSCPSCYS
jgi:hypothetical protein